MDRRRGLATSAAIAITIASSALAIWPGFGLVRGHDTGNVGKYRPAANPAQAGPGVVRVVVPGAPTSSATAAEPGDDSATTGTTVPGSPAAGAAAPARAAASRDDDPCHLGSGPSPASGVLPTTSTGPTQPFAHAPATGSCPTQSTGVYDDRRDD